MGAGWTRLLKSSPLPPPRSSLISEVVVRHLSETRRARQAEVHYTVKEAAIRPEATAERDVAVLLNGGISAALSAVPASGEKVIEDFVSCAHRLRSSSFRRE